MASDKDEKSAPEFRPGFRLSDLDVAVILVSAIATGVIWQRTWWIGFVIAFVTAHARCGASFLIPPLPPTAGLPRRHLSQSWKSTN